MFHRLLCRFMTGSRCAIVSMVMLIALSLHADDLQPTDVKGERFLIPAETELVLVAQPPLVDRPINADWDEAGRLYVTESSGTNDDVRTQLRTRPHRVLRLEDADGDGVFDRRTIFAEGLMFPEGAMWLDGSFYVAAPPSIWKLTDTNDDGVADQREEWFNGQTLTGCANDLHGPYRGPDGWIYWCKGAFAEQTYEQPGRSPLVTRAAHIFRRRPEGGPIESVMAGGMDNPVELVFTPGGERIFNTTFLVHPGNGQRDGLIHAIYGGVYGKDHGVLDGHPRTGDLMPVMVHLGAAAPSGLTRLQQNHFGAGYVDQIVSTCFNMRKLTGHRLTPLGATFEASTDTFLEGEDLDFHPTDVLEDADGSLLIIDTGGWYKLCCPTSQLHKPDVLGAIYRLRRKGGEKMPHPRGLQLTWEQPTTIQLLERLIDTRPAVRHRAATSLVRQLRQELATAATTNQPWPIPSWQPLLQGLKSKEPQFRRDLLWVLAQLDHVESRALVRQSLADRDPTVRQVALHAISMTRDPDALSDVLELMTTTKNDHNRRVAAEVLGRLGSASAVRTLLAQAETTVDRTLVHSITYGLIEIGDASAVQQGLAQVKSATAKRVGLIALDQMPGDHLAASEISPLLESDDLLMRETAAWIVMQHPEWGSEIAAYLQRRLDRLTSETGPELRQQLVRFSGDPTVQQLIEQKLVSSTTSPEQRQFLLLAMAESGIDPLPASWISAFRQRLEQGDHDEISSILTTWSHWKDPQAFPAETHPLLHKIAEDAPQSTTSRLHALRCLTLAQPESLTVNSATFRWLLPLVAADQPLENRAIASAVLSTASLTADQLDALAEHVGTAGPMDLDRLLKAYERESVVPLRELGLSLVRTLESSAAKTALPPARLEQLFSRFDESVRQAAQPLFASLQLSTAEKTERLDQVLSSLPNGDIRRGQRVFHDTKVACYACHAMGYLGGKIGPDLTHIGKVRQKRDLLEALLYPSASFVRSYEPVTVTTHDGKVVSGIVHDDGAEVLILTVAANQTEKIRKQEIEEVHPGQVSIMPAGLDQQLSQQQLADLLEFLLSAK